MPVDATGLALDLELELEWESTDAAHKDRYVFSSLTIEKSNLPAALREDLSALPAGAAVTHSYAPGELVTGYEANKVRRIRLAEFQVRMGSGFTIAPRAGRFYPRKFIASAINSSPKDNLPFRVLSVDGNSLKVDLNHPLARYPLDLTARLLPDTESKNTNATAKEALVTLCDTGPGMQADAPGVVTEFITANAFERDDSAEDSVFYAQPRLVAHLDTMARQQFTRLYARFVKPGMKVLDLMSSWQSHLPADVEVELTGLGMNAEEMGHNPQLNHSVILDLNRASQLPFTQGQFDLAICTVSVEYLIDPVNVFRQVAAALNPGAAFVVTFSDRWFPPKAIQLWKELHPFEKMGLVLEYFRQSQAFHRLATESLRGLPRPSDDKYALPHADPLYAVWGYRK